MRRTIFAAMTNDNPLTTLVPGSRMFESGSIVDTPAEPFLVLRWGPYLRHGPNLATRTFQVWAHQARGSYDAINDVLAEVQRVVTALEDVETPWAKGIDRVSTATLYFSSGELFDQEYKTNCRYVEFRVAGRER